MRARAVCKFACLCALMAPIAVPAATDSGDAFTLYATAGVAYDSNLFRLPDADSRLFGVEPANKSDTVLRVGAGFKFDKLVSRQRYLVELGAEDFRYRNNRNLDAVGLDGTAAWLWQVGNLWQGDLRYRHRRYLAGFVDSRSNLRDMVNEDSAAASASYRLTPRWRAGARLSWVDSRRSEDARRALDFTSMTATLDLDYLTPAEDSFGMQLRTTRGDYPNRQVLAGSTVDNAFREDEASAVLGWQVTGDSRLDGRIGYTRRVHDQIGGRDFSGVTLRARFGWRPTAKTRLDFSAWRETRSWEDLTANYILAKGASIEPGWEATPKLLFHAKLLYEQRDYLGDPAFVASTAPRREDRVRLAQVGASYALLRNLELTLNAEAGRRESNAALFDYSYRSVFAGMKFSF